MQQALKFIKDMSLYFQASRAQILKHATDYIQFMSKKNNAHQMDIDDLKHQNVQLESQGL